MGCNPSRNPSYISLDSQPKNTLQNQNTVTNQTQDNKDSSRNTHVMEEQSTNQIQSKATNQNQDNKATHQKESEKDKKDNESTAQDVNVSLQVKAADKKNPEKLELTDEEIEERKKKTLDELKKSWEIFKDGMSDLKEEDGSYKKIIRVIIYKSFIGHFALKGSPLQVQNQFKREFYTQLVDSGAIQILCDLVVDILLQGFKTEDGQIVTDVYKPLANSLSVLTNFSDNEINRTDLMVNHPKYLQIAASTLKEMKDGHFSVNGKKNSDQEEKVVKSFLSHIHNIAMHDENVTKLRNLGFIQVLIPYMNSPIEACRLSTLASLADIVDEKDSAILSTDKGILKFLITSLTQAIVDPQRRKFGWSTAELARTVRRIARNDANKRLLVELGVLQPLVDLAKFDEEIEQKEAVGAMWTLSFNKENQKAMIQDNECSPVDTFIRLRNSPYKRVSKICNGALWTMREKLKETEKYKNIGNQYLKSLSETSLKEKSTVGGHVMISYQWANQELLKSVRDGIRAKGLQVWMDIDDISGSTLDAMAAAVENADLVLVCYSQKYKDSDNCRAEAEYAFQKKKKIIPLKMERDYKPDGWLGFIIGAKLFFDFSGKYTFDSRMEGLLKELHIKLGNDDPDGIIVPEKASLLSSEKPHIASVPIAVESSYDVRSVIARPVQGSETVKKWTPQQVSAWLTKHQIPIERFRSLTGIEVAFLQVIKVECPDFFYKTITETLKITDLLTMSRLRFALDDTTL